jgi:hypothetical protein
VTPTTQPGKVIALIVDAGTDSSGVKNATLVYSSDGGHTWNRIRMDPNPGDKYSAVIPPQNSSQVDYYIQAYDYAGNLAIANNMGHYYTYGNALVVLLVAGIVFTLVVSACVATAVSSRRKRSERVDVV